MNQMGTRRKYTDEFKAEAVRLANQQGTSIQAIADDLGINAGMLRRWVKTASRVPSSRKNMVDAELNKELVRLRRENARLKTERDIIKKALVDSSDHRNTLINHV